VHYTPRDLIAPHACLPWEDPTTTAAPFRATTEDGLLRAAFRDLQGARLHGFAMLVTLGDRPLATRLASAALADGASRAGDLRHPERAAAWLRARVLRGVGRRDRRSDLPEADRRAALAALGVNGPVYAGLARLEPAFRAALVVGEIERLEPLDVEMVLGTSGVRARRMVAAARAHYLDALATEPLTEGATRGPARGELAARVQRVADAAMLPRQPAR
jgi:hypothetical protein